MFFIMQLIMSFAYAQNPIVSPTTEQPLASTVAPMSKAWYEVISIRGYAQVRYNRIAETNDKLLCDQCDKSLGDNGGFFVRRARLVFSGDIGDYGFFYIQPDFASSATDQNYSQLRDIYFDLNLSNDKSHRLRIGQSKVPYGFENLQSSQNRLALDRNDALNSAVSNERDLGAFYYWATPEKRKLFSQLVKDNLKGSGDYGLFAIGAYNGQAANKQERNDSLHLVTRFTYPFELSNGQIIEASVQGYTGKFISNTAPSGAASYNEYADRRVAASFVIYPKPFGFQAEYNVGRGAAYDEVSGVVENDDLEGGYVQAMYRIQEASASIIPYAKYQKYDGGKKHENGAPLYNVEEFETGVEWQANKFTELTTAWAYGDRRVATSDSISYEYGSRVRLQLQFNY